MSLRGRRVWDQMRRLELQTAERLIELLHKRGCDVKASGETIAAIAYAIRTINGVQLSVMLHGPGPYAGRDPSATAVLTRMLMQVLGTPSDEAELKKLLAKRRKAAAPRLTNGMARKAARRAPPEGTLGARGDQGGRAN